MRKTNNFDSKFKLRQHRNFLVVFFLFIIACEGSQISTPIGGYAYPRNPTSEDERLYFYQLKNSVHGREYVYFRLAYSWFSVFDEENLSIHPRPQTTIRLSYFEAFGKVVFIVITPQELIIKKGTTVGMDDFDSIQLTPLENYHFQTLDCYYPLTDTLYRSKKWKFMVDSLTKVYPQLLDSTYYFSLYQKAHPRLTEKRPYQVLRRSMSYDKFNSLLRWIGSAGYWKLPYTIECDSRNTDGFWYYLEINTPASYKVGQGISCPPKWKLSQIAQYVVRIAGLEDEIQLDQSWEIYSKKDSLQP